MTDPITPLSDSDEQAIREREKAATPGPWAWANTCEKGYGANVGADVFADDDEDCRHPLSGDLTERDDYDVGQGIAELSHQGCSTNAAFIAHARSDIPNLLRELTRLRDECARLAKELGNESRTVEAQSRMIVWCVQRSAQLFRRGDGGNQEMMLAFIPSGQDGLARSEKTGEALPCYTNQIRVSDYPNEGAAVYDLLKIAMRKTGHDVVLVPSESASRLLTEEETPR